MFEFLQNSRRFRWVFLALVFQCSIGMAECRILKNKDSDVSINNLFSGSHVLIKETSYATAAGTANKFTLLYSHITKIKKQRGMATQNLPHSISHSTEFGNLISWGMQPDKPGNFYFYAVNFEVTKWDDIVIVSSNWEAEGCEHPVICLNKKYLFDTRLPEAPQDYNKLCTYNGMHAVCSEDFKTPAEFDITKYVRAGPNRSALPVFRQRNGHYQAAQDMLKLPETEHSIYLFPTSELHVFTYFSKRATDHQYKESPLSLPPQIRNYRTEKTWPDNSQNFKAFFISSQKMKIFSQKNISDTLK